METENRLIADFIGAVQAYKPYVNTDDMEYDMYGVIPTIEDGENEKHYFLPQEMLFDTDWNWLMTVVQKIDELCGIDLHEWDEHINNALCSKSLTITYNACVEFIKWFEEFKK
jgi:hypothetical protein